MAGDGTLATTAIITKGLTGGHGPLDPCKSGLITTPFSLYCTGILPPVPPSAGGGPYPRDAWNKFNPGQIKDFYKPVPEKLQYYIVPKENEAEFIRRKSVVTIRVKFGENTTEKEYMVPLDKSYAVVKAFNVLNKTQESIQFAVTNLKKVISDITITVKRMRRSRKK